MIEIIKLLFSTGQNYYNKAVLKANKEGKILHLLMKTALFTGAFNLALLLPLLFLSHIAVVLIVYGLLTLAPVLFLFIDYRRKTSDLERLDNAILATAEAREQLFALLKKDLFFTIKCAAILPVLPTVYQIVLTSLLVLLTKATFLQLLILTVLYLTLFYSLSYYFLLNYFVKRRDRSNSFFKIDNYRELTISGPLYLLPFGLLFALTGFLLLSLLFKSLVVKLLLSPLLAALFSFLLHLLFSKIGFYDRHNRKLTLRKLSIFSRKYMNNILKSNVSPGTTWLSLFYPLAAFFAALTLLLFTNKHFTTFFSHPLKITIFQALLFSLFFIYPLLKRLFYNPKHSLSPFLFTSFLFTIVLINSLISHLNFAIQFEEGTILLAFQQFIEPLTQGFNLYIGAVKSYQDKINYSLITLLPLLFIAVFYINYFLYKLIIGFENIADRRIKKSLNREESILLFGDSLSLYPVLFTAFFSALLLIFLQIELPVLSTLIFHLIDTLQISSIFKFDFLTKENIDLVFKIIFYLSALYMALRLLLAFLSSILSHFMLFSNELVYLSDNLLFKTTLRIPLSKINYVVFKQNLIEKLLDIGTIFIETNDRDGLIKIKGINNIKEKNILIMEKIKIDLQKT